ncbi:major tail protein [Thermoactinomyces sp. DSM 45892]|uniref:major tail protein n=1 Tax=Thermoactinomyces sp. DSM 45892 TaxID=1882753 RepID=UPI00089C09A0|nr:major tail protein [Thermoactinomyces sp. DSM 45892]SDY84785.1 phage major tail protein, phi13 family [Thermoactinomyces sp. DSM 45892]
MAVQVGLKDVHYAILTKDDVTGIVYEKPVPIRGAISAKISPSSNTETLYADDGPSEVATALGEISVELNMADLPLSVQASLLGHKMKNGILIKSAQDTPPYVAIGFKSMKSNGHYRYIWLYKGKFTTPESEYQTKEDSPSFQTPSIQGAFVKRDFDGHWQAIGDEDETGFTQASNWFQEVQVVAVTDSPTPEKRDN